MNIDVKILNKILSHQIHNILKELYTMIKQNLSLGFQHMWINKCDKLY